MSRLLALLGVAAAAIATPAAAQRARTTVVPYIEITQTIDADLKGGDVLTYTSLAAGIDAQIDTARVTGQASYRYERRIAWDDDIADGDIHTGLARVAARVTPALNLEAGAIATRTRSDIRGDAPGLLVGNVENIAQIYSLYAGPTVSTEAGALAINGGYRIGYTKVETPVCSGLAATAPRLDYYDDALGHQLYASVGTATRDGPLPVGVTVSGAYEREDAGQLSQRYEGYYGRWNVVAPISPYLALAAGVGYERIETSQRDALVTATGAPVLDDHGRFVEVPGARRIACRTDGVYYDAGVIWRPNRRTSVEARIGERYGSTSYTGSLSYQASADVGLAIGVYDSVTTFGRQLRNGLTGLPTSFLATRDNALGQQFNGCVFGTTGAAPGGCLNDVFQSISTASFRARGVDGILTARRGRSTYGAGAGYANRKLFAPNVPSGIVVYGLEDESYYGQAFYQYSLSPVSSVNANAFANYYTSELIGTDDVISLGLTGSYFHKFGRLSTTASLGLYTFEVYSDGQESSLSGQALLGARYSF